MTMKTKKLIASVTMTLMITACAQQYDEYGRPTGQQPIINKEIIGGVLGAAGGAAIGSNIGDGRGQIAAIAIGTLLGTKLGASVGSSLDKADMMYYNKTSQQALETGREGQSFPWDNPNNNHSGTITPKRYYQRSDGTYCREYSQTVNIGGHMEEAFGTACRQNDGTWKISQ